MKLITALGAIVTSALLTVPTVTEVGEAKVSDIGRSVVSIQA